MITPTSWVNPVATSEARQNLKVQLRTSRTEMQDRLALMAFLFGRIIRCVLCQVSAWDVDFISPARAAMF